ncbi:MAG: hypothetical protein QW683_07495 [Candidatus Caldarchaeum sp.]
MSNAEIAWRSEMQRIEANRILLILFLFRRHGLNGVTNSSLAETTIYRAEGDYIEVRRELTSAGYIQFSTDTGEVQLTERGVQAVLRLLSIDGENRIDLFVRRLRVFTLSPIMLRGQDFRNIFDFLILTYNNVCSGDLVRDLLRSIAEDQRRGLLDSLLARIRRAVLILLRNHYQSDDLYLSLFEGYWFMMTHAYLVRLWSFCRFNRMALHTIVRFGALVTSGWFGRLNTLIIGMILSSAVFLLLNLFGVAIQGLLLTVFVLASAGFLILVALPRLIDRFRDLSRMMLRRVFGR